MRRLVAGGAMLAAAAAAGYAAHEGGLPHQMPDAALPALDELPSELPHGGETLVCPDLPAPCDAQTALGILATRDQLPLDGPVPETTANIIIGSEDHTFWEHNGVDPNSIARAIIRNAMAGRMQEGGSGIARQTAGLIYPKATAEQLENYALTDIAKNTAGEDVAQQVYEGMLAVTMDRHFTKDQILHRYLSEVYFGRGAYGFKSAARAYFNKEPGQLSLQENVVLAAVIPRPSEVDADVVDYSDPEEQARLVAETGQLARNYDLTIERLLHNGVITKAEADQLRNQQIHIVPYTPRGGEDLRAADALNARHFIDAVKAEAIRVLGISADELDRGYKIHTTLNVDDQAAMQAAIAGEPAVRGTGLNAAAVSLRWNGSIAAMVGGTDYMSMQFNLAADAKRDSGSSNKPFAYAAAIEREGWNADTMMYVEPSVTIPGADNGKDWIIGTHDGCDLAGMQAPCAMPVRDAIAHSSNTAAGQVLNTVGVETVGETMRGLGMRVEPPYPASIIVGSGQLAPLDAATGMNNLILREGSAVPPFLITSITNHDGTVTYFEYEQPEARVVFDKAVAHKTAAAMTGVLEYGTASGVVGGAPESRVGKTGTSDNGSDLWFTGSGLSLLPPASTPATPAGENARHGQTASFWLGNPEAVTPIDQSVAASRTAAQMWGRYMSHLQLGGDITQ